MKYTVIHEDEKNDDLFNYETEICPRVGEAIELEDKIYIVRNIRHILEKHKVTQQAKEYYTIVYVFDFTL